MRLKITKSKNASSLYVIQSTYENKKHSSKIVEKLGTYDELQKKLNGEDPIEWAKKYIEELNKKEKENNREVLIKCFPSKLISKDDQRSFNGGYLFLQHIYHELNLHKVSAAISKKYRFSFDLNAILSRLLYGRILFPSSKLATYKLSSKFVEQTDFELQHVYRALEVISKEMDFIQSSLYSNSLKISKRNTGILYYDCTNYFFEIEQADGLKQYGASKEHRPNPIIQMGLFMDGDGIPLAFSLNSGNTNEQITLKPLEQKILSDFKLSKFVVCTDAGLASENNRRFNNEGERAFITTQSIKKLKKHLKEWALDPSGWHLADHDKPYDIAQLDEEANKDQCFFKERWIKENGLEQKLIVTYSIKYKNYQRQIRHSQIERAQKLLDSNPTKLSKSHQNDYKRFIKKTSCTSDGEIADNELYALNNETIVAEEAYDGFYAVCTNLEGSAQKTIRINQRRWEIEECFRIMKSEFKARPVYLSREDRIKAHFTTCFISLIIYRLLEKKLGNKFTCSEVINGLREMNFYEIKSEGYIPTYTRTDFTDSLHEIFGFRTDYEIIKKAEMKKLFNPTKKIK
ncbi:IS1634 family transposase [Desulfosporosinus youngiae]|uniref:Transposase n=1 Tax=Desulfosporosinus youngiae DSM 17734 TaxID=768710 RepID=H5XXL1_9FIRM|nr:IS1634 family transposase [Desulfosporosinus youngiae]EHQ91217.1 transposase [Desulfosporosinus youngiae DSM 17734]